MSLSRVVMTILTAGAAAIARMEMCITIEPIMTKRAPAEFAMTTNLLRRKLCNTAILHVRREDVLTTAKMERRIMARGE